MTCQSVGPILLFVQLLFFGELCPFINLPVYTHTNLALNLTHKLKQELEGNLYIFTILTLLSLMTIAWNFSYSHMKR